MSYASSVVAYSSPIPDSRLVSLTPYPASNLLVKRRVSTAGRSSAPTPESGIATPSPITDSGIAAPAASARGRRRSHPPQNAPNSIAVGISITPARRSAAASVPGQNQASEHLRTSTFDVVVLPSQLAPPNRAWRGPTLSYPPGVRLPTPSSRRDSASGRNEAVPGRRREIRAFPQH